MADPYDTVIELSGFDRARPIKESLRNRLRNLGIIAAKETAGDEVSEARRVVIQFLGKVDKETNERLADIIRAKAGPTDWVIVMTPTAKVATNALKDAIWRQIVGRPSNVELAAGVESAAFKAWLLFNAFAERRAQEPAQARTHPLTRIVQPQLRSDQGRLDAVRIANRFGMTYTELAKILGTSVQAMTKTPDSERLQTKLQPFARIHLLTQLKQVSPEFFRGWLRTPLASLDGATPLDLIKKGEAEEVAELVENRVTGQPS